jgi:hypothetical protein
MKAGEVLGSKPFFNQQRHRQRVADRQRRGGTGGRDEIQRARFLGDAAVERDVGCLRQ